MAKRFYWLQLKEDFFRQKEIKMLRKIAGGDTYSIIYLKMMLMSLKDEGKILYEGVGSNIAEEIALEIDEDIENVQITINYLISKNLMVVSDFEGMMKDVPSLIGSETDSARRVRKHREIKEFIHPALQCNDDVTNGNTEIDIELDKELDKDKELEDKQSRSNSKNDKQVRHKYGEYNNVLLTDDHITELKKLYVDYEKKIENLSEYMETSGKKYKNHYATIKSWAKKDVADKPKVKTGKPNVDEVWSEIQ